MPLNCENHTVSITDRGGNRILGVLESVTDVQWERVRDDISTAKVTVAQPSGDCFQLLNDISCNRHEMVIYRGGDRVWEGVITHISRHADVFQISARDVMHYAYRTAMHSGYDNAAYWHPDPKDPNRVWVNNMGSIVDRALNVLTTELNRKKEQLDPPINVVPYITAVRPADISQERRTGRKTLPFAMTVYDDMESMASLGGLDYTVVGRRIILSDTRVAIGRTAPVTEGDFLSEIVVTSYGMDSHTRTFTTGEDGMYGVYPPWSGHPDPKMQEYIDYYGEWENVEQMMDEDSAEPPSQLLLDSSASLSMSGRLPVPTLVRLPENSQLNPNGVLSIQDLVPGVIIPVRATLTSIVLTQNQQLNNVTVNESGEGGEAITISLGPPPTSFLEPAA